MDTAEYDEKARAETIRQAAARVRAALARDGYLPPHAIEHGQRWALKPVPYPYEIVSNDAH